jgi:hypothetical protein
MEMSSILTSPYVSNLVPVYGLTLLNFSLASRG